MVLEKKSSVKQSKRHRTLKQKPRMRFEEVVSPYVRATIPNWASTSKFLIEKGLSEEFQNEKSYGVIKYFLSQLCGIIKRRRAPQEYFYNLNARIIKDHTGIQSLAFYAEELMRIGIIERSIKKNGVKSFGYRLTPEVYALGFRMTMAKNKRAAEREEWRMREAIQQNPNYEWLTECLKNRVQCPDEVFVSLESEDALPFRQNDIQAMRDTKHRFSICRYGRFHSVFTNISSQIRSQVLIDRTPTVEIDIVACQPYLFASLLEGENKKRYIDFLRRHKDFYEGVRQNISGSWTRKQIKEMCYTQFFFCKYKNPYGVIADFFEQHLGITRKDYRKCVGDAKNLAHVLQRLESKIVIETAVTTMKEKDVPLVTVHDCFLVKNNKSHINIAKQAISKAFYDHVGIEPILTVKKNVKVRPPNAKSVKVGSTTLYFTIQPSKFMAEDTEKYSESKDPNRFKNRALAAGKPLSQQELLSLAQQCAVTWRDEYVAYISLDTDDLRHAEYQDRIENIDCYLCELSEFNVMADLSIRLDGHTIMQPNGVIQDG